MSTRPGTFAANAPIANLATLVCRVGVSVEQISHTKPDKCEFHPSALATVMPSTLPCESPVQWGTQMALRWIGVLVVCLGLSPAASAGERSGVLHRVSCSVVRYYVAKYSAAAAEQWARSKGATEAEIDAGRHCLNGNGDTTRTARAPARPLALGSFGW